MLIINIFDLLAVFKINFVTKEATAYLYGRSRLEIGKMGKSGFMCVFFLFYTKCQQLFGVQGVTCVICPSCVKIFRWGENNKEHTLGWRRWFTSEMTRIISNGYNISMTCYIRMKLLELKPRGKYGRERNNTHLMSSSMLFFCYKGTLLKKQNINIPFKKVLRTFPLLGLYLKDWII